MTIVFADTYYFIALLNQNKERCSTHRQWRRWQARSGSGTCITNSR